MIWVSCLINVNVEGALNIFKCTNQASKKKKNLNETHIGTMRKWKHKCKQLFFK